MGKIEEITDEIPLPVPPPTSGPGAAKEKLTMDEHLKRLEETPLFMRDLPDGDEEEGSESQAALEALKSLTFDGTPDEVAQNFKNHGNEYYVGKRYAEAKGFYTQGIEAHPTDLTLLESLYLNRAACNLELENFGQALRDTSSVLKFNSKSVKAFFRGAKALLAINKTTEAIDCCDHALLLDEKNTEVKKLKQKIVEREEQNKRVEIVKKERERRKKEGQVALNKALLSRGLWMEVSSKPPDNPSPVHFDPESLEPDSASTLPLTSTNWVAPDHIRTPLIFPVFFLYPQYAQSDLISHFHEDTSIADHLNNMFPAGQRLPWDSKNEYHSQNLVVYATTHKKRLLRCGRKLTLREIMDQGAKEPEVPGKLNTRDGIVMKDGLISLVVLPKGEEDSKWVEKFKKERDESQKK